MACKAGEIRGYGECNEAENCFGAIKTAHGLPTKATALLLNSGGSTLLTTKSQIFVRWAEHFESVLNRSSTISEVAIVQLFQVRINIDLDLSPSLPETILAI
nr:unnamed protein product [Spirometra erinaceieuropaei]